MVMLDKGVYFCHSFDLGTRLDFFDDYEKRESLTDVPNALRYKRLKHENLSIWVNELGLLLAFQRLDVVENLAKAYSEYKNNFDQYYSGVLRDIEAVACKFIEADSSFIVHVGSQELVIDWKAVHVPIDDLSFRLMLEAVFIDELCRTIDKRSRSFVGKANLSEERLVVQYVENLFPLAIPANFLVGRRELEQMGKYYSAWRLDERVAAIRARFTESVTNTTLYRGHLDRHRQSAMNYLLAAIAVLSITQVSEAISNMLQAHSLFTTKDTINKTLGISAIILLAWGFMSHVLRPVTSLWLDDAKRKIFSWKILKNK